MLSCIHLWDGVSVKLGRKIALLSPSLMWWVHKTRSYSSLWEYVITGMFGCHPYFATLVCHKCGMPQFLWWPNWSPHLWQKLASNWVYDKWGMWLKKCGMPQLWLQPNICLNLPHLWHKSVAKCGWQPNIPSVCKHGSFLAKNELRRICHARQLNLPSSCH